MGGGGGKGRVVAVVVLELVITPDLAILLFQLLQKVVEIGPVQVLLLTLRYSRLQQIMLILKLPRW